MAIAGLADAQRTVEIDVSVVATTSVAEDPLIAEALTKAGVATRLVGPVRSRLHLRRESREALADVITNADVVHIHGIWEEILHLAATEAGRAAVPYIVRPCGMLSPWCLRQKRLKKALYRAWRVNRVANRAAALHFTTAAEQDAVAMLGFRSPAIVEPNGIDVSAFEVPRDARAFRKDHLGGFDGPYAVSLGRLHPVKGLDVLIQALAHLDPAGARLVVAGPGDEAYREGLLRLARRQGVKDRVHFVGMLRGEERLDALHGAELLVLASRHENFGLAVVEALASGTPVVISDQVDIRSDIIAAGVGAVVELQPRAFARAIGSALAGDLWGPKGAVSRRCRDFAFERYDWRSIAQRWRDHYAACMA